MALVRGEGDGNRQIIRLAMLDAESEWLAEAADAKKASEHTRRTIAIVIADAFHQQAKKYETKEKFNDDNAIEKIDAAWGREH